mmetsp:Transcript_16674/g.23279  ORF Transcript_16674/g.23279 Transcript_16674/m.23279 type:complete len:112 (-) Transcript_16674:310-645(-)
MSAEIANVSTINSDEGKIVNAEEIEMIASVTEENAEKGVIRIATAGGEETAAAMTGTAETLEDGEAKTVSNVGILIPVIVPSLTLHHGTTCTMTVTTILTGELRVNLILPS